MKSEKEVYEMDDLPSRRSRMRSMSSYSTEIESNNFITFKLICRRCKEDASKGELIRPCLCSGDREFIHVRCLEIMTNIRQRSQFCAFCDAPFPIERKFKPLIEWCRNTRALYNVFLEIGVNLLKAVCLLIYNVFMVTLITVLFTSYANCKEFTRAMFILINITLSSVFVLYKKYEVVFLKNVGKNIYSAYYRWLDNNKENKVIKRLDLIHQI